MGDVLTSAAALAISAAPEKVAADNANAICPTPTALSAEASVGAWLRDNDRLRASDFDRAERATAVSEQSEGDDESLVAFLLRMGLASERDIATAWSVTQQLPLLEGEALALAIAALTQLVDGDVDVDTESVLLARMRHLSERFLRHHALVPFGLSDSRDDPAGKGAVDLLMADPSDSYAQTACAFALQCRVRIHVGIRAEIDEAIERLYGKGRSAMSTIVEALDDTDALPDDVEHLRDMASEAPVIRLVNLIIQRAVEDRASDIHIEPFEQRLKVRYRVDGVLQSAEAPPASSTAAVISRIKIMARLDIAERRLPQDGRIMLRIQGRELDLRVSTLPTSFGESVVMRILDRESVVFDLATLGFDAAASTQLLQAVERPHGILLVTGPTGSGKTTTLYTALSHLNTPDRKIITVEDPVEYQLDGINQIQVKPAIGLHFAGALRSIVRQDPDVIMIGEMRDLETCKIAIQSALTGHLVLSTLHTNSAAATIARLLDMGADDYLVASTVHGIVAQRLVRRLVPEHSEAYFPSAAIIDAYQLTRYTDERPIRLYKPRDGVSPTLAYHGRCVLNEFLAIDDTIRQMIVAKHDAQQIERHARDHGMTTMFEDGLRKALAGVTTLDEVLRSTSDN